MSASKILRLVTSDRPPSTLQEQAGGTLSLCFNWFVPNNSGSFNTEIHLIGCNCFSLLVG
jgi:hypothetical protein